MSFNNRLSIVFSFVLPLLFFTSTADADLKKNVLILNSYHPGYKWTDEETQGAVDALASVRDDCKLHIEYMGTKMAFDDDYCAQLRGLYKHKFQKIKFDVIITMDDDAFNFMKKYRDEIFPGTPVVFCGTNWFDPGSVPVGFKNYTGVNEDADITATLDLMLKLHPGTKNIYVINDTMTTGQKIHSKFDSISPGYNDKVKFIFLENMDFSEILDTVGKLGSDSLVLLTIFQKDKSGQYFEFSESSSLISTYSRVPVYGLWDFNLGFGIVGGMLTSAYYQGKSAGEVVVYILKGVKADAFPVIMKSPNHYMFDYTQLQRWNISLSVLPGGSVIINEPVTFYDLHKGLVWGTFSGFFGLTVLIILLVVNIRKRIKTSLVLQESEKRLSEIIDFLPDATFAIDLDGKVIVWNRAAEEYTGVKAEDIMGRGDQAYSIPFYGERRLLLVNLVLNPNDKSEELFSYVKKNGAKVSGESYIKSIKQGEAFMFAIAAPLLNFEGRVTGAIESIRDITEQKKLEQQLRQSQKMEAIGNLAGGIAHDFNNILTAIMGYGTLLRLRLDSGSPLLGYADDIIGASEKAAYLTKSLLAFSRKQEMNLQPVNLNEIVNNFGRFILRVIGADVECKITSSNENLTVMADSIQIEQVLMNLATNARDAMPGGGILSIKTDRIDISEGFTGFDIPPGSYAVLSISDTGNGMDDEMKQKIFEPFFTTKEKGKGTGLGLSIVYGIVKQHGGVINVFSNPGTGTVFMIYIPIIALNSDQALSDAVEPPSGGSETILMAEDDYEIRMLIKQILEVYGYTVITAVDGEDAVNKFLQNKDKIQFLFFDVVMPKKSGRDAYFEIHKMNEKVPVLFTSGYAAGILHERGLLEEDLCSISKPVNPNLLLGKIRELLDKT